MNKKYFFIIAGVLIIAALVYFLSRNVTSPGQEDELETVTCGNRPISRFKYPSKAFPAFINDYSSNFKVASGLLDHLAGDKSGSSSISLDVQNNARQLRDTLNQDNIFFENNLKAYFFASNNDPCNDSLRFMYLAYVSSMTNKIIELKQFIAQVSSNQVATQDIKNIPHDSILAVLDTAKAQVDTTTKIIDNNKLIVLKDYRKLNSAVGSLQNGYKVTKINPASYKAHQ